MKQKILMTLALLITAASGAWADKLSESITTSNNGAPGQKTYTGEHFTISGPWADFDGIWITGYNSNMGGSANTVTISSNNGEKITKIEAVVGDTFNWGNTMLATTSGDVTGTYSKGQTITISSVNATTVTLSSPVADTNMIEFKSWTIYYAPAPDVEVTTNAASEGATFTEAWFNMPANDVTVNYELVRDMSVQMTAQVGDGTQEQPRYRVKKDGNNKFIPADMEMAAVPALFTVNDAIEQKALTQIQDYIVQIYAIDAEGQPTGDPMTFATFTFEPGIYAVKAVAADGSDYDGETALSNTFKLFQGYEIEVPAGEFATFYKDEPLYADTETSADAVLYTVSSVSADKAVLSSAITTAPSLTPLLVFNSSDQAKTFLLIPTDAEPNLALTVAPEFVGTLEATTIAASTEALNNYALNGLQFVWVMNAIPVAANKCWLQIPNSEVTARNITLVFGDATGVNGVIGVKEVNDDSWYDLNGRKVNAPTKKGVYILNGKKVVIK